MKHYVFLIIFFLIPSLLFAEGEKKNMTIGTNILQIPATSINFSLSKYQKPFFTAHADAGYTINYFKSLDIIGFFLTPHIKCGNDGYSINKISGGYIKLGGYFNLRKDFEKQNFWQLGVFATNSIVYEKGYREDYIYDFTPDNKYIRTDLEHTQYIFGLNVSLGYNFRISEKLRSNIGFQVSFPHKNYKNLYGYRNYIPGMGFKDSYSYWFPILEWKIKKVIN